MGVADNLALRQIISERAAESHGGAREDAARGGNVAMLDVRDGASTVVDLDEKIEHVAAGGRVLSSISGTEHGPRPIFPRE